MEDSNPYESIDAMAHSEHQEPFRGDQGMESDPAHQMMDNYVSILLPVLLMLITIYECHLQHSA